MKHFAFTPVLALALFTFAAGCSGNDGEISVEAVKTPLTDQGKDSLFVITIVKSRDGGYAPDKFKVKVTPDGKDAVEVTCVFNDVNTNKVLDKGDTLACSEGADNKLGADVAGKAAKVELFDTISGAEERVGDATWTPAK